MFRRSVLRWMNQPTRSLWEKKAFESHSGGAVPGVDNSFVGKTKTEFKKMLKIQLVLIPVCAAIMIFMFPTPSAEDEKRMRIEYEKNAGWKT